MSRQKRQQKLNPDSPAGCDATIQISPLKHDALTQTLPCYHDAITHNPSLDVVKLLNMSVDDR